MGIHSRIKELRLERGMSQTELARRMGYKDKSSISKIESGSGDLTQTQIFEFAEALDTSPIYLLDGKEPEQSTESVIPSPDITTEDALLIEWYHNTEEHNRDLIRRMMAYENALKKDTTGKAI